MEHALSTIHIFLFIKLHYTNQKKNRIRIQRYKNILHFYNNFVIEHLSSNRILNSFLSKRTIITRGDRNDCSKRISISNLRERERERDEERDDEAAGLRKYEMSTWRGRERGGNSGKVSSLRNDTSGLYSGNLVRERPVPFHVSSFSHVPCVLTKVSAGFSASRSFVAPFSDITAPSRGCGTG